MDLAPPEIREMFDRLTAGQRLGFERVPNPNGHGYAWALSVRDGEYPGSNILDVTDAELLAKLRSINGQFEYQVPRYDPWPLYWHENLPKAA